MKIKLTKPVTFFSSAKHVIVDVADIVSIEDCGETRDVTLRNGTVFSVSETVEQIEKLSNPSQEQQQ